MTEYITVSYIFMAVMLMSCYERKYFYTIILSFFAAPISLPIYLVIVFYVNREKK